MAGQKEQVTQRNNKARGKKVTSDNCHGHLSPPIGLSNFWSDKMTPHSWEIILSPVNQTSNFLSTPQEIVMLYEEVVEVEERVVLEQPRCNCPRHWWRGALERRYTCITPQPHPAPQKPGSVPCVCMEGGGGFYTKRGYKKLGVMRETILH